MPFSQNCQSAHMETDNRDVLCIQAVIVMDYLANGCPPKIAP